VENLSLLAPHFRLFQWRLVALHSFAPPGSFSADPSLTLALVETNNRVNITLNQGESCKTS